MQFSFSFSFSHLGMNAGFFTNRDTSSLQARQTRLCASTPKDWMHRCDSLSFQLGYLDVKTLALYCNRVGVRIYSCHKKKL